MEMFSLVGKVALVTGASRGLGRVIAETLAKAGARVVLAARDEGKLADVAGSIRSAGGSADTEAFDMNDEVAVAAAIGRISARHGSPHILVNNAGISPRELLLKSTLETWDEAHRVNARSAYLLCREVARGMIERREGRIINVTSYVADLGRDGFQAYSSSKAAMSGLTRSLACELGPFGITVNNIAPGLFFTDMGRPVQDNPVVHDKYREVIALGRAGNPSEIGGAALFLASSAGSYVTGTTIEVDGGVANVMPVRFSQNRTR